MLTPYFTNWTRQGIASDIFDEMENVFNSFNHWTPARKVHQERTFTPACDISEEGDHYLMSMDLPGLKKEDIKIEVNNDLVTVSGERKFEPNSENKKNSYRFEKSYGSFKRSFGLPTEVDSDRVEAQYENGVLSLYLPKIAAAQPRKIEIQSGKTGGFFEKLLSSKKTNETLKEVGSNKAS